MSLIYDRREQARAMIFKTRNPDVVAYLRACRLRGMTATLELNSAGGQDTIRGKVLSVMEKADPDPHWEINIQTN